MKGGINKIIRNTIAATSAKSDFEKVGLSIILIHLFPCVRDSLKRHITWIRRNLKKNTSFVSI